MTPAHHHPRSPNWPVKATPRYRRRLARRRTLALTTVLAALALCGAPAASALTQRGHVSCETCTFGSTGEGALSHPGQLAVSATTGDVYVLDRGHRRIDQYTATGTFIATFGFGVRTNTNTWQVCTGGCHEGRPHKAFQLSGAQAIAVDNSTNPEDPSVGDIYIAAPREHEEEAYEAIEKLSPDGKQLERITKIPYSEEGENDKLEEPEAEETHGLTVGVEGTPWLYYEESLYPVNQASLKRPAARPPLELSLNGEPANGLAVDSRGRFYTAQQLAGAQRPTSIVSEWQAVPGSQTELEELLEGLDYQNTTAVAVNPRDQPENEVDEQDQVYLTNTTTEDGASTASVAQFGPEGALVDRFTAPGLEQAAGVAVNLLTGAVYVTDAAAGDVDLFTLEEPAAPSVDSISVQDLSSQSARLDGQIDPRGAATTYAFRYSTAPVPPAGEPCVSPCVQAPTAEASAGEGFAEDAVQAQLQAASAAPLAAGITYRYRLIARNAHGVSESAEASFSTPTATAGSLADDRVWEMVSPPDKEGAEAVVDESSPGGLIQAAADGDAIAYLADGPFAAPEGSRSLELTQILSARAATGWSSRDITTPNDAGSGLLTESPPEYEFFSPNLALSLVRPFFPSGRDAQPPLSPPLTAEEREHGQQRTIYLRADQPIAPQGQPDSELYAAARADGQTIGNPGYVPLISDLDAPGIEWAAGEEALRFRAATPDLAHVVLESYKPLTAAEPENGLYEWSATRGGEGTLSPVNVLPGGAFAPEATLGIGSPRSTEGMNVYHALSQDGSRAIFTAAHHLYLRDMTKTPAPQTIQLDTIHGGSGQGPEHAVFHTASADGSRVFFTDEQQLTPNSGASAGRPDLYVCEITENDTGMLECALTDLTPRRELAAAEFEAADVRAGAFSGGVIGTSEDGAYVYFVADGVLCEQGTGTECVAENAEHEHPTPGLCRVKADPQATCNLYVSHYQAGAWQPPRFIASLSTHDQPDWEGETRGHGGQAKLTARVSPNGLFLAFMSQQQLTGYEGVRYDNDASATGADGARAEEVYEYALPTGALQCASCEPSGGRPTGVFDPGIEGEDGSSVLGILVDRQGAWAGRWLAGSLPEWAGFTEFNTQALYQSRYLSNTGRLYFDSPERLAPQDTNGLEDVYEYEPSGVPQGPHRCTGESATFDARAGGCVGLISSGTSTQESAFLDASETGGEGAAGEQLSEGGGDVFFVTAGKLVPEDTDEAFDVYDAHECTAASPCVPPRELETPPACETSAACASPLPAEGGLGALASAPPGAPGNTSSQHAVLSNQEHQKPKPKSKPPTTAQRLAAALHVCHTKDRHHERKRVACERAAHKHYPAPSKATKKKTRGSARALGRR